MTHLTQILGAAGIVFGLCIMLWMLVNHRRYLRRIQREQDEWDRFRPYRSELKRRDHK